MATIITPALDQILRRVEALSSVQWAACADNQAQDRTTGSNVYSQRFANGTGARQADSFWSDTRTVSAGSNDDLDLTTILAVAAFTCIKGIQVENLSTVTGDYLLVGKVASVTNGWEGPFGTVAGAVQRVDPEGCYCNHQTSAAGWTVDATHKVLRINNPGASSVEYRLTLYGEAT